MDLKMKNMILKTNELNLAQYYFLNYRTGEKLNG